MQYSVTQDEYAMLASFRYSLRRFLRFSERAAVAAGLTPTQHQAMLAIKGIEGAEHVTIADLAERLQIQHHSAVGLVDRLAARGLVERRACSGDRRQVRLCVTPAGEQKLAGLAACHRDELHRIGPDLVDILLRLTQEIH